MLLILTYFEMFEKSTFKIGYAASWMLCFINIEFRIPVTVWLICLLAQQSSVEREHDKNSGGQFRIPVWSLIISPIQLHLPIDAVTNPWHCLVYLC